LIPPYGGSNPPAPATTVGQIYVERYADLVKAAKISKFERRCGRHLADVGKTRAIVTAPDRIERRRVEMKTSIIAALIVVSGSALGQTSSLKPGLWEMKMVRLTVDGRDMAAQLAAAQARMQETLAGAPEAQRKQIEEMMRARGVSPQALAGGPARLCVSADMAARNAPIVDAKGGCQPAKIDRSGDETNFEFNCSTDGRTIVGKGVSAFDRDTLTTRVDMTMADAHGSHAMHKETEMQYLGSDCQGLAPVDQIAREALPQAPGATPR
jgi:hypothetical protein